MASAAGRRLLSSISVTNRPRIRGTLIPNYVRSLPLTPSRWYRKVLDTITPEVDFQHFFISMYGNKYNPMAEDTKFDLIDLYIKTLAKVVGSEREAKKRIYKANCGGERPFGFGCQIDLETSVKLRGLPGVSHTRMDKYVGPCYKDYGGEFRFKDGKVFQTFRSRKGTESEIKEISLPRSSYPVSLSVKKWSELPPKALPWLLLPPPAFGGRDVEKRAYRFYSIAQQREFSINHGFLDYDARFVGSSHGWLALSNPRDNDLFLWNPITGCDIKLPPVDTLPIPEGDLRDSCIRKVIVSCSPATGSSECRVLMIYGPKNQLAFCCPGHSSEWTPFGEVGNSYDDIIYSPSHKLFFCITTGTDTFILECWNLGDSSSPLSDGVEYELPIVKKVEWCNETIVGQLKYLVLGEQQSNPSIYVVTRHILKHYSPNGHYVQSADQNYPYRTSGFDVIKFDQLHGDMWYTRHSLDGLAMFIGTNHSFAIPAKDFPELQRDCIFFTDENKLVPPDWANLPFGLPDMDVFNYRHRWFYSNYFTDSYFDSASHEHNYMSDAHLIRRRVPPLPMWFTPTLH